MKGKKKGGKDYKKSIRSEITACQSTCLTVIFSLLMCAHVL